MLEFVRHNKWPSKVQAVYDGMVELENGWVFENPRRDVPYHIPEVDAHPGRRMVNEVARLMSLDTRGVPNDYENQVRAVRRATNVPANRTCRFLDSVREDVQNHYANTTLIVADEDDAAWMAAFASTPRS